MGQPGRAFVFAHLSTILSCDLRFPAHSKEKKDND